MPDEDEKTIEDESKLILDNKKVTCPHCLTVFDLSSGDILQPGKNVFDETKLPDNKKVKKDLGFFHNPWIGEE